MILHPVYAEVAGSHPQCFLTQSGSPGKERMTLSGKSQSKSSGVSVAMKAQRVCEGDVRGQPAVTRPQELPTGKAGSVPSLLDLGSDRSGSGKACARARGVVISAEGCDKTFGDSCEEQELSWGGDSLGCLGRSLYLCFWLPLDFSSQVFASATPPTHSAFPQVFFPPWPENVLCSLLP